MVKIRIKKYLKNYLGKGKDSHPEESKKKKLVFVFQIRLAIENAKGDKMNGNEHMKALPIE